MKYSILLLLVFFANATNTYSQTIKNKDRKFCKQYIDKYGLPKGSSEIKITFTDKDDTQIFDYLLKELGYAGVPIVIADRNNLFMESDHFQMSGLYATSVPQQRLLIKIEDKVAFVKTQYIRYSFATELPYIKDAAVGRKSNTGTQIFYNTVMLLSAHFSNMEFI